MSDEKPDLRDWDDAAEDEADAEFAELIAQSVKPSELSPEVHDSILLQALGPAAFADLDQPAEEEPVEPEPTPKELVRADKLRRWLEDPNLLASAMAEEVSNEDLRLAALARALRLAYAPVQLNQLAHERLVQRGLKTPRLAQVRRLVTVSAFTLVAAAAALIGFFYRTPQNHQTASADLQASPLPMIEARSMSDLFDPAEPLPRSGGETERADKIAGLRGAELRDNLFASWGVE